MKLYIYKSKTNTILYMAKTYRNSEGKSTSKIIERLGTLVLFINLKYIKTKEFYQNKKTQ